MPANHFPDNLPFPIKPVDSESRTKLAMALVKGILASNPALSVEETLHTADDCIAHFEIISSAVDSGFLRSYDHVAHFNGYPLRIYMPELEPES